MGGIVLLRELAAALKSRWRAANYDESAFADLAAAALVEFQPAATVSLSEILEWVQSDPAPPIQVEAPFGTPLTVFFDSLFYIDLLTWIDGTADIHEHGFSGAFTVISGLSLHSQYDFVVERRYCERLMQGRTALIHAELLRPGDVRPIHVGKRSAHSLFHLERPSVSLVVRTRRSVTNCMQLAYLRSGLAYDPFFEDLPLTRLLRSLSIMREIDHPGYLSSATKIAANNDAFTAFRVSEEIRRQNDHETYLRFLGDPPARHEDLFRLLYAGARERLFEQNIVELRRQVTRPSHRFLLAALLNLRARDDVLKMVSLYTNGSSPQDDVLRWIEELASEPSPDPTEPNAIRFRVDDTMLEIIRLMLRGDSDDDIVANLLSSHDVSGASGDARVQILELCEALRNETFLAPLLTNGAR